MEEIPNLLTTGGISVVVIVLFGAIKTAVPDFDSTRFGALTCIIMGIVLSVLNAMLGGVAPDTVITPISIFLVGLLGGAAASGIYSAGRGTTSGMA